MHDTPWCYFDNVCTTCSKVFSFLPRCAQRLENVETAGIGKTILRFFYQSEAKLEPPGILEKSGELLSCLDMTFYVALHFCLRAIAIRNALLICLYTLYSLRA